MFEKTLSDLVKGLRSNKRREAEFVSKCIAEIKDELVRFLKRKSHISYYQKSHTFYDQKWQEAEFVSKCIAEIKDELVRFLNSQLATGWRRPIGCLILGARRRGAPRRRCRAPSGKP